MVRSTSRSDEVANRVGARARLSSPGAWICGVNPGTAEVETGQPAYAAGRGTCTDRWRIDRQAKRHHRLVLTGRDRVGAPRDCPGKASLGSPLHPRSPLTHPTPPLSFF